MSSSVQPADTMAHQTANPPSIFTFPPEVRNLIYKHALVAPNGVVIRSLAPPALLHASHQLRDEAAPVFYSENRFEITVGRSAEEEAWGAGLKVPSIDACAWNRFLHKWDWFRTITSYLRHVKQITLIYELSMGNGCRFGDDEFDRRLGFRFSSEPFAPGDGEVAAFELCSGDFDWPSRRETHHFLFDTMVDHGTDKLWSVYPIDRLTTMLWRGVRDCPLASVHVDFLCEDDDEWTGGQNPYTHYDPADFFDPEDEDDE